MSAQEITKRLFKTLSLLRDLTRWDHWYESKIPLFFILGYTLLILHGLDITIFLNYIRLILFTILFLAFGYSLNDYCDQEYDLRVGKPNSMAGLPSSRAISILTILFGLGWICLPIKNPTSLSLAALAYFCMAFYSLPPLRIKERGLLGLVIASIAQRSLPGLLFFEAFQHWKVDTALFGLLYLFIGLRWIIGHQIWDFENDLHSGVKTYATQVGKERLQSWLKYLVFPAELAFLAGLLLYYFDLLPWLSLVFGVYLIYLWITFRSRHQAGSQLSIIGSEWIPLADFYFILWPLSLALYLALRQPLFWIVLFLNILWEHWLITLQIQALREMVNTHFFLGR